MIDQINKMYDALYNTQAANLKKTQDKAIQTLNEEKVMQERGFYNQENRAAQDNAMNVQRLRDYMANRNLATSGENIDAMLRQGTDYSNAKGAINSGRNDYLRGYNNNIYNAKKDYETGLTIAKNDIEAKRAQDIMAYQQQMAAASYGGGSGGSSGRSSGGSSGRSSGSSGTATAQFKTDLDNQVAYSLTNPQYLGDAKKLVEASYAQGYISDNDLAAYLHRINSTMNAVKSTQASVNKGTFGNYKKPNGMTLDRM